MKRELVTTSKCLVLIFCFAFLAVMRTIDTPQCEDTVRIKLPKPRYSSSVSVEKTMLERRSVRSYKDEPLTVEIVSQLLWAAQGITNNRGLRTAPSGGALYPLEVYVVAGNVTGLPDGIYSYKPHGHELVRTQKGDKRKVLSDATLRQLYVKEAPLVIVFSAVYERITKKYGERGNRYAVIEVGHAAQNVYLQAVSLNLGTVAVGAFRDDEVKKLMKMEDGEHPLYLMPIGKKKD